MSAVEKTIQQEIVESHYDPVSWGRPVTDGFMRSCLELVGVPTRGTKLNSEQLLKLCDENGLPFREAAPDGEDRNRR